MKSKTLTRICINLIKKQIQRTIFVCLYTYVYLFIQIHTYAYTQTPHKSIQPENNQYLLNSNRPNLMELGNQNTLKQRGETKNIKGNWGIFVVLKLFCILTMGMIHKPTLVLKLHISKYACSHTHTESNKSEYIWVRLVDYINVNTQAVICFAYVIRGRNRIKGSWISLHFLLPPLMNLQWSQTYRFT